VVFEIIKPIVQQMVGNQMVGVMTKMLVHVELVQVLHNVLLTTIVMQHIKCVGLMMVWIVLYNFIIILMFLDPFFHPLAW
jgi:hypothetical protein